MDINSKNIGQLDKKSDSNLSERLLVNMDINVSKIEITRSPRIDE